MKRYPVVRVEWIDAQDRPGTWHAFDEVKTWAAEDCLIVSYGLLLHKSAAYVALAADVTLGTDGALGRVTKIPRGWIRSIRRVKG